MIPKDFNRNEIEKECEKIELLTDQINYLENVLKEYVTNPPELDDNIGLSPSLEDWIEAQIRWRKTSFEEINTTPKGGIVKIKSKYGLADITRIFEAMKKAGIINTKTETIQIANLFFSAKEDITSFTAKYNATKTDIRKNAANSNSDELLEFIKILITTSYNKKENVLNEIENHILDIKDNLI
jgi:hypothetical protein